MQQRSIGNLMALSLLWSVGFLFLAGVAAGKAWKEDPELLNRLENHFGVKISGGNYYFTINDDNDDSFLPKTDQWSLAPSIQTIDVQAVSTEFEITTGQTDKVEVSATGRFNEKKTASLLEVTEKNGEISIREPKLNSVRSVKTSLVVPKNWHGNVQIKLVSGDLQLSDLSTKNIEIKTVSGDLVLNEVKAEVVNLKTVSGEIRGKLAEQPEIDITSVSGDVRLKLSSAGDFAFDLKTISGDIENQFGIQNSGKSVVKIRTTSGDVTIEKQ